MANIHLLLLTMRVSQDSHTISIMESESGRVRGEEIYSILRQGVGTGVVEGFFHNLSHCCLSGQGHVDEEFISREAFGIAPSQERLRSGGGGFGGVQICHGVHVVSCHLVDTRSTHWLT